MQIIIPMAGIGKRFKDNGYTISKYLLKIEGKTIIEKIISNFDINNDIFLFICNENDFYKNKLKNLFDGLKISYKIILIGNHKLGPIYSIIKAKDYIENTHEIIVNYCDFYWKWNYIEFKNKIKKYDGLINIT